MTKLCDHIDGMDYVTSCAMCGGEGAYLQTYTIGCGQGYTQMVGRCDYCDGTGLRMTYGGKVPASVISQIVVRAAKDAAP